MYIILIIEVCTLCNNNNNNIEAIHARKSPLLVYLFTTSGEAFIRILTIVFKVGRITKMLHLNESLLNSDLFKG